jgi:hypothetical protein
LRKLNFKNNNFNAALKEYARVLDDLISRDTQKKGEIKGDYPSSLQQAQGSGSANSAIAN